MAQLCPACNTQNPDGSLYCVRCGIPLASATSGNPSGYGYQQQAMGKQSQSLYPGTPQPVPMGTVGGQGQDQLKYRHAFAGYGIPVMHHSWLLEGEQGQALSLHTAVMQILGQRNFLGFKLTTRKMKESGYQMEERDYIIAQRGVSTVFIYVAPTGRDIYISRATSVLPSIDIFRVITLCILIGVALFGPSILTAIVTSSASNSGLGAYALASILAGIFTLLSFAIWIYLIRLVYLSFRYWLAEKDFWIYLRRRDLNDFQLDDIALLEHATDETVLTAVKHLGLDASKIVPPTSYQPERHIRVV